MSTDITHIKRVEIKGLWQRQDLEWNLHPDVNILAGANGSGKSTILNCIYESMIHIPYSPDTLFSLDGGLNTLSIYFNNNSYYGIELIEPSYEVKNNKIVALNAFNYTGELIYEGISKYEYKIADFKFIKTFDTNLISFEYGEKISDDKVRTSLDLEIHQLQKLYLSYQLDLSKAKDKILDSNSNPKKAIEKLRWPQLRFWEMLDSLFYETNKKIDREANEISFLLDGQSLSLSPYLLSSGEKQLLVILLTVLIQNQKPSILFMDEPEISLHVDWQKKLIGYIRELNPNVQLIIATHSPALIMEGWHDKVFEVSDLIVKS